MAPSILVIGLGNEYRSDDGVGPVVARALQSRHLPGVRCMQDPGDTLSLIDQWNTADTVILIDALVSEAEPGTISRFDVLAQPIPTSVSLSSTHSFDLAETLRIAEVVHRLPSRLLVYGVEGKHFGMGVHLSPQVKDAVNTIIEQVERECLYALLLHGVFSSLLLSHHETGMLPLARTHDVCYPPHRACREALCGGRSVCSTRPVIGKKWIP